MLAQLVDVLSLLLLGGSLVVVAAVGMLALPWKDEELAATARAVRHGWRSVEVTLRRLGHGLQPRGVPVRLDRFESPSVAFEPPSAPAA